MPANIVELAILAGIDFMCGRTTSLRQKSRRSRSRALMPLRHCCCAAAARYVTMEHGVHSDEQVAQMCATARHLDCECGGL